MSTKLRPTFDPQLQEVLQTVELGRATEEVTLASGRRYELAAGATADQLTVRSASGKVLLRVAVTDEGPLLSFESASITLAARSRMAICAPDLELRGERVRVVAGELEEEVAGHRHARVRGEHRVEAASLAMQASEAGVAIKAMDRITLDGDHIGLNDDPSPAPFAWSSIAENEP